MNKTLTAVLTATTIAAGSLFAGQPMMGTGSKSYKQAPPPPPAPKIDYGVGPYFGIKGGVNVYQDYQNANRNETISGFDGPVQLRIDTNNVGGYGGAVFGYGFGGGGAIIQPALELEAIYNGFDAKIEARGSGATDSLTARVNTVPILANLYLRYNMDQLKPYVMAGAGTYWADAEDVRLSVGGSSSRLSDSDSVWDFAWQVGGGAEYFFNEKISASLDYRFLSYEGGLDLIGSSAVRNHLVGVSLKFWF